MRPLSGPEIRIRDRGDIRATRRSLIANVYAVFLICQRSSVISLDGESAERFIHHDCVAQHAPFEKLVRVGYPGNVGPEQILVAADSKVHDLHAASRSRVDD